MCGLKQGQAALMQGRAASHTLRGCVDWNVYHVNEREIYYVTPFVGVWIETLQKSQENVNKSVTPFVGVWIETT